MMKFLGPLLAVLILVLAIGAYFYFRDDDLERTPIKKTATAAAPASAAEAPGAPPRQDFSALSAELQGDMTKIPGSLRGARQVPAHAYNIKSRLDGAENLHPEYGTVVQVCDLIIYADQEFSVRQGQVAMNQNHTVDSSLQYSRPEDRERVNQSANDAIFQQQETLWGEYRKKTDAEVKRLLATLAGKQL